MYHSVYTGEVQQEIEAYFDTAADLVHKQRAWTADKNAMRSIVAGCCDKSDVSFRKPILERNSIIQHSV